MPDGSGGLTRGRGLMSLIGGIGVRPQLSLVALIAIAPLLALLLFGVMKSRALILQAGQTRALDLARLGAERQDDSFQDAKNVLTVLRRLPQVTSASLENCHAELQSIARDYPEFTSIGLTDAEGALACFSRAAVQKPFADQQVFRAAMAADSAAFVVGGYRVGVITGKPIVFAATPLPAAAKGEPPRGIAFVAIDLNRAATRAADLVASTGATIALIDTHAGTLLVRSPDPQDSGGKTIGDSPLVAAMRAHPEGGRVEAADVDGTLRIFGFAPLTTGGGSGLMVAVGLARADILADANRRLALGVAVALLTASIAAYAAWLFADRTQVRAIRRLVETAGKIGAGDLAARAEMGPGPAREFRALGDALGEMANSLARAQGDLAASERQLRLLADNSTDMILLLREDGRRLYASPACRALLGYEPEEMLAIRSKDALHPDDIGVLKERRLWSGGEPPTSTYRMRRKDGGYVWVESSWREAPVEPGQMLQRVVIVRNVEMRLAAEARLRESETRYRLLAEHSTDMVFQLAADLTRRYVSPACREILGYEPDEWLVAPPLGMVHPDDGERVAALFQSVISGAAERATIIHRMRHRDGRWIWVEAQLRTFIDPVSGAPAGIIGALRDISARKGAEDLLAEANLRLETLAGQDSLTGLPNRRTFDDALAREYRRALRDNSHLAMIMIDVDRFKLFNDRYGHPAGDEALRRVGRAIEGAMRRAGDVVARYGGEEFAVLLPDADEAGAGSIAERISAAVIALGIAHDANPAKLVTISAGVAAVAPHAMEASLETLVEDADRALYRAKDAGRNAIVYASALQATTDGVRSDAA